MKYWKKYSCIIRTIGRKAHALSKQLRIKYKHILLLLFLLFCCCCFYYHEACVKCRVAFVKRLPVLYHSTEFILYFLWDNWALSGYFENRIPLKLVLGVCLQPCTLPCCIWKDSIKLSLRFLFFCVFFVSKDNLIDVYFTSLQLMLSAVLSS